MIQDKLVEFFVTIAQEIAGMDQSEYNTFALKYQIEASRLGHRIRDLVADSMKKDFEWPRDLSEDSYHRISILSAQFPEIYPSEPIGGTSPYHRCSDCKRSDPEIDYKGHYSFCKWQEGRHLIDQIRHGERLSFAAR